MNAALGAHAPLKVWLLAIRPRTLVAGLVPILLGDALVMRTGQGTPAPFLAALAWMLLIQIASNLTNDYFDFKRGADTAERVGPVRVTQSGLLSAEAVLAGSRVFYSAALLAALYLAARGGWPVVFVVGAAFVAAYAYTGGPFPLAYHGLGDVLTFIFFGLVPVALTYYVQTGRVDPLVWAVAVPPGLQSMGILMVNNLRDADTDARVGKRTLVVQWGRRFGQVQYATLLGVSFLVPVALWASGQAGPSVLLPLLALPLVRTPLRRVLRETGAPLNAALGETARLELAYGLLLVLGLWLDRLPHLS